MLTVEYLCFRLIVKPKLHKTHYCAFALLSLQMHKKIFNFVVW